MLSKFCIYCKINSLDSYENCLRDRDLRPIRMLLRLDRHLSCLQFVIVFPIKLSEVYNEKKHQCFGEKLKQLSSVTKVFHNV